MIMYLRLLHFADDSFQDHQDFGMIRLAQYAFLAAHIPLILANHVDQARAQVGKHGLWIHIDPVPTALFSRLNRVTVRNVRRRNHQARRLKGHLALAHIKDALSLSRKAQLDAVMKMHPRQRLRRVLPRIPQQPDHREVCRQVKVTIKNIFLYLALIQCIYPLELCSAPAVNTLYYFASIMSRITRSV